MWSNGPHYKSYTILFRWSQPSYAVCWVPLDARWFHCIYPLDFLSLLWHRCGSDLSHKAIRDVLKFRLHISDVDIDGHTGLESLWACFNRWFEFTISQIIQIDHGVDRASRKMVGLIYKLFSSSQSNDLIGVLYYLYLFGKFMWIYCTFIAWHHPSPIFGKHHHGAGGARACIHLFWMLPLLILPIFCLTDCSRYGHCAVSHLQLIPH